MTAARVSDPSIRPPIVISVDGPLGSGKTPLCKRIEAELANRGFSPARTSALSETELGAFVRAAQFQHSGRVLALIAAADRQLQLDTTVKPAIDRRDPVIIDRYLPTAVALDGMGSLMSPSEVLDLYPDAPIPTISILVDADVEYRSERLRGKGLLEKYDDWHLSLEDESTRYRDAAEFLTERGWKFKRIDTPIESLGDEEVAEIVSGLLA